VRIVPGIKISVTSLSHSPTSTGKMRTQGPFRGTSPSLKYAKQVSERNSKSLTQRERERERERERD
jgi:hypothetical protein